MFGLNSWASKGVFPEGTTRGLHQNFSTGESGEIGFSHWKSRKQLFLLKFSKPKEASAPLPKTHI